MKFEKDAKKSGVMNLIWGSIPIIVLLVLHLSFFNKPDISSLLIVISWLVVLLVSAIFIGNGISLIRSGGKWVITVNNEGISWSSPNESVDKSFKFKISELKKTETRIRRKKKSTDRRDYVLILANGNEQKLSPNSGINLVQVIVELERFGIKNESLYEEKR